MRLAAVWDREGTLLAATALEYDDESAPHPVPGDGQDGGILDVPGELAEVPLEELCLRLRVDVKSGRLVEAESA